MSRPAKRAAPFDVVVVGEILAELYCDEPLADGAALRLGFSGDALNAAAAAAAAGARTAVLTSVGDGELGDAIVARVAGLGIDTSLIQRRSAINGAYLLHGDLSGHREFTYWRTGSATSQMGPADIEPRREVLAAAGAVVLSGVFAALSDGCADAALATARIAAGAGAAVVYDPNFRPRLTTPARAKAALARIAPHCAVMTPSCPGDARPLLDTGEPRAAVRAVRALGARAVAVTSGSESVLVGSPDGEFTLPVPRVPDAIDATGAGDVFAGTLAARLALGDPLLEAAGLGVGAASLSVAGRGGTGLIPTLADTRRMSPFASGKVSPRSIPNDAPSSGCRVPGLGSFRWLITFREPGGDHGGILGILRPMRPRNKIGHAFLRKLRASGSAERRAGQRFTRPPCRTPSRSSPGPAR